MKFNAYKMGEGTGKVLAILKGRGDKKFWGMVVLTYGCLKFQS